MHFLTVNLKPQLSWWKQFTQWASLLWVPFLPLSCWQSLRVLQDTSYTICFLAVLCPGFSLTASCSSVYSCWLCMSPLLGSKSSLCLTTFWISIACLCVVGSHCMLELSVPRLMSFNVQDELNSYLSPVLFPKNYGVAKLSYSCPFDCKLILQFLRNETPYTLGVKGCSAKHAEVLQNFEAATDPRL